MAQDRESGAEGSRFGREAGSKIIAALGGTKVRKGSNEFMLGGERLTVHCAHQKNSSVGVTHLVLKRCDAVWGAFEQENGSYKVFSLPTDVYANHMRPTRSTGPSAGRVSLVSRSVFEQFGSLVAELSL